MSDLPRPLAGRGRLLARLIANGLGPAVLAAGAALLIQAGFDRLVAPGRAPAGELALIATGLGLAAVGVGCLRALERIDAERLGQGYAHAVRLALFDRIAELAPRALARRTQGGVSLRFVGDLTALRRWVSLGLARLAVGAALIGGVLITLMTLDIAIGAGVAAVTGAGMALVIACGRPMRTTSREARRRRSRIAGSVSEQIGAIQVIQVFGQAGRERRRLRRQSRRLRDAMLDRARVAGGLVGASEAAASLAATAALLIGAIRAAEGAVTPGTVVAAMAVVGVLAAPLRDLGRIQEYRQGHVVALENIRALMAVPERIEDRPGAVVLRPGPGRLRLIGAGAGAVRDVTAQAPAGAVVALVGPNGAGKSTLLAAIARLIEPREGRVLLDDQDLAEVTLASLRRAIGFAGPDLPLLRGSVERNLRYRAPDATAAELDRVLRACGLDELVAGLPNGLATQVGEGGRRLSAGQRQRIALGRALMGDPPLLLLDEIDAHLDPMAAAAIDRAVAARAGTTLIATHRPDRARTADLIWHLAEGRLVACGPPADVLPDLPRTMAAVGGGGPGR